MNLQDKRIAVTGATGFIGRYIVDVLQKRGARVIGVVRNPDRVPELRARGVELRRADLAERDKLTEGFRGADALVSNAALFSVSNRDWEEHQRTNLVGTTNVFEAAADAGIRRVVHISSVAGYSDRVQTVVNEDHPQYTEDSPRTRMNAYPISKGLSERLAWRIAGERGIELTTLRPCAVYGAFDPNFTKIVKRLIGWPIGIFPSRLRLPLVYAGDVAEAVALSFEKEASIGRAYNVTGDDIETWQFLEAWKQAGGKTSALVIPIPVPRSRPFDHTRATNELGWNNRPYADALRETLALEAGFASA